MVIPPAHADCKHGTLSLKDRVQFGHLVLDMLVLSVYIYV